MITYGLAVSDAWVQDFHEQTLVALRQAEVAPPPMPTVTLCNFSVPRATE